MQGFCLPYSSCCSSYPAWKWVTKNARIRIEPPPSPRDIILLITIAVAFVGIVALFLTTDWSNSPLTKSALDASGLV